AVPMFVLRIVLPLALMLAGIVLMAGPRAARATEEATDRARRFVPVHTKKVRPPQVGASPAWRGASISRKPKDFAKKIAAQNELDKALSNKETFRLVKAIKEDGNIDDPVLARAIDVIYLAYLEKQLDADLLKKMTKKANDVEQAFNTFRARVDDKEMTDSEVRKVLKDSTDSARRKAVWEASKKAGKVVEADLKKLVRLRNKAAVSLGFKNFHALQLFLNEQDGDNIIKLFDKLDDLTREPFKKAKAEIDQQLAKKYGVKVADLMPWHYHDPFFQET